jgi:hypothetical protein
MPKNEIFPPPAEPEDGEKPETMGEFADRLTPGLPQSAYGYVWTLAERATAAEGATDA